MVIHQTAPSHGEAPLESTTVVLSDDPAAQELLGLQSSLSFASVTGLSVGAAAALGGMFLIFNHSDHAYLDGRLQDPPAGAFFKSQTTNAAAVGLVALALGMPVVPMVPTVMAMLGAALISGLSTLDSRGRTTQRVLGRAASAGVMAAGAAVPAVYLFGAWVLFPPLLAAFLLRQFYPIGQATQLTLTALPYASLATAGLLTWVLLALPAAVAAASASALVAVLLQ